MKKEKYLELFKKFINGKINIEGVFVTPYLNEKSEIVFTIDNPNDIPYTKPALEGYIQEEFSDFHKLIGFSFGSTYGDFKLNGPEIFVNKNLLDKIGRELKKINTLTLDEIKLSVIHKKFDLEIVDGEMVHIKNYVTLKKSEIQTHDGIYFDIDFESGISRYKIRSTTSSIFNEHEQNYLILDKLFDQFPVFVDPLWQVYYVTTEFLI